MQPDGLGLSVLKLNTHYGASHVLQGLDLEVPPGSVTAVVGRNGVGKTTLINTIMGIVPATSGRVLMDGIDLLPLPPYARRRLGIALVPQGRRLFRSLTVEEHLQVASGGTAGSFTHDEVYRLFPQLYARRKVFARSLSGGEQSMLSIGRALVTNPRLLLMDEPTEGLAPVLVDQMRQVVLSMKERGITVLLVEQNLGFVMAVADSIAVMHRGKVTRVCEPGALTNVEELTQHILLG